jgi:hypothetical protein
VTVSLVLFVDVAADAERTWAAAVDWESQGEWMLGTRVRATEQDGQGVGGGIEAITGFGPVAFTDTMRITTWEPPRVCEVLHTGRVVRGTGRFAVEDRGGGTSRFHWREDLELPLGTVGRIGWVLVRPLFAFGVQLSLNRFSTWVSAPRTSGSP